MFKKLKEFFIRHDENNQNPLSISKDSLKDMARKMDLNSTTQRKVEDEIDMAFDVFKKEIGEAGGSIDLNAPIKNRLKKISPYSNFIKNFKMKLNITEKNQRFLNLLLELSDVEISYLIDNILTVANNVPIIRNLDRNYYYQDKKFSSNFINNDLYKKGLLIIYSDNVPLYNILKTMKILNLKEIASANGISVKGNKDSLIKILIDNKEKILKDIDLENYLTIPKDLEKLLIEIRDKRQFEISKIHVQQTKETFEAMIRGGYKYKTWLTSRDALVCENCQIDGETVLIDKPFSNGEMYPSSRTCKRGCRCTIIPSSKP